MNVLIGAADLQLATLIIRGLRAEGIRADVAGSGSEASSMATAGTYDALVIDEDLADQTGLETCRALRGQRVWTPIVMLTQAGRTEARDRGRTGVADDYLTKPFALGELLSRLRVVGGAGDGGAHPVLRAGDLELDPAGRSVQRGDRTIDLSHKEFALLETLIRRSGDVVDRGHLLDHVWDYEYENRSNIVDVYVGYLREKVDRPFGVKSIETVRGTGYRLRADGGRIAT